MKHITEYRDSDAISTAAEEIRKVSTKPFQLMEVCGTHTVAISKFGLRELLPSTIKLLSGPGCPVCVTPNRDIDWAIEASGKQDVIMTTYGDMMKVPGSKSSFQEENASGADIRVVYSTLDALKIAEKNPEKKVIFFGVGFETTTPTLAIAVQEARKRGLANFYIYPANKTVPEALKALASADDVRINGLICPGHVSVIIGSEPYEFLAEAGVPCVISGFEPLDIMQSIFMLTNQLEKGISEVEIQYKRGVKPEGNLIAKKSMEDVFEPCSSVWRGIGEIPGTGLTLRSEYIAFDARELFDIEVGDSPEPAGCFCGEILRGVKLPFDCKLFGKTCVPEHPVGPCMVSTEGSCAAYYRYQGVSA